MRSLTPLLVLALGALPGRLPAAPGPAVDVAQIIRESNAIVQRPEPAMTPSEQAVYEKVVPILSTRPTFALKLLRAMATSSDADEKPSPAFEFMLGNANYAAGDNAEAERRFREAVDRNPEFVRAWNNLGVLYYTQDQYEAAAPCFARSISLGDRDATTFGLLGNAFEKTGNTVSAEVAYMQALAVEPANVNWMEGLLRIYLAAKQHGQAETLVRTLIRNHPLEARYQLTYANLLLTCGRAIEATALLDQMRTDGLARAEDLGLLADLYADQRMTPEALATLDELAAARPALAEQRALRFARSLVAQRAWDEAATVQAALERMTLSPAGRITQLEIRVETALARKNWLSAKAELEALLALAPANGTAWLGLGQLYLGEAEPARAEEAFEHARQIPASAYRACLELANLAFKQHAYERCLANLEQALAVQRSPAVENFRDQIKSLILPGKGSNL